MRPAHPVDALRVAEGERCRLRDRWPEPLELRRGIAHWLLRLAIRLDRPPRRRRSAFGAAARR